jgi:hypothetical protein
MGEEITRRTAPEPPDRSGPGPLQSEVRRRPVREKLGIRTT